MEEKDCKAFDVLRTKKQRTKKENARYEELLRKFFQETLYHGESVEEQNLDS